MTPDLMSNSQIQGKLEEEFSSSSEVTWDFIPGTPSLVDWLDTVGLNHWSFLCF